MAEEQTAARRGGSSNTGGGQREKKNNKERSELPLCQSKNPIIILNQHWKHTKSCFPVQWISGLDQNNYRIISSSDNPRLIQLWFACAIRQEEWGKKKHAGCNINEVFPVDPRLYRQRAKMDSGWPRDKCRTKGIEVYVWYICDIATWLVFRYTHRSLFSPLLYYLQVMPIKLRYIINISKGFFPVMLQNIVTLRYINFSLLPLHEGFKNVKMQ